MTVSHLLANCLPTVSFLLGDNWLQSYFSGGCSSLLLTTFNCVFRELVNTTLVDGKTGNIMLNRKGDRINAVYQIVNLRKKADTQLTVVGEYRDRNVTISKTVFWPGGQGEKPKGIFVSTNLRVGFNYEFN